MLAKLQQTPWKLLFMPPLV